jgi:hypothetical protein
MATRANWSAQEMLQPAPAPRFDGRAAPVAAIPARDQHRAEILALLNG